MSTRGLIGCRWNGIHHGSYNHMDSYPEGLGQEVVDFCTMLAADEHMFNTFAENFEAVEWIEDQSQKPTPEQLRKIKEAGFTLDDIQPDNYDDWYDFLRGMQGIGYFVQVLNGFPYLIDNSLFLEDSLFCEYAYILDLDRRVLEFWGGFQKIYGHLTQYEGLYYHEGEFASLYGKKPRKGGSKYKYGACKKIGEKSIYSLDGWMEIFEEYEKKRKEREKEEA